MSRRNMYGNKRTVHHTILFWVFLTIGILGMFGILIFLVMLERASNILEFIQYFVVLLLGIGFVVFCFWRARQYEKQGISYGEAMMEEFEKIDQEHRQDNLLDYPTDADLISSRETVGGMLEGREFDLLDQDGDGKIAIHEYYPLTETEVLEKILKEDKHFSKSRFYTWTRMVFQSVMRAFSTKDVSLLRSFEEDSLYIQHKQKIQQYIDKKETRKIDRIVIKGTLLKDYRIEGDKQVLVVALAANLVDALFDSSSHIISGHPYYRVRRQYILTFVRNVGVKTTKYSNLINTTCPNCGASVQLLEDGTCSYCGSVVTTGKYGWVLLSIKDIKVIGENGE